MPRIYTASNDTTFQERCYSAFLTGSLPAEGCLLVSGPHVFFLTETPALPECAEISIPTLSVERIFSALPSLPLAKNTCKAFTEGRRLPAGCALAATAAGIFVFPSAAYEPDLGAMKIFSLSFDPLEEVLTPQEAAALYDVNVKRLQSDCETAGVGSPFAASEVRKSGNTYLLLKSAAERVYLGRAPNPRGISPFLLVFSTVEAAYLWNRDASAVRSAAGGAGHAAARMQEGDRRKSGRTWLVRREAMERLFGQAVPERMLAVFPPVHTCRCSS